MIRTGCAHHFQTHAAVSTPPHLVSNIYVVDCQLLRLQNYSVVSNNRAGCNKHAGLQILKNLLIMQDVINMQP